MLFYHFKRFSKEYITKLESNLQKTQKSLIELDYKELFLLLKKNEPTYELDIIEYFYLLSKIANIIIDFSIFQKPYDIIQKFIKNNIGFEIWYINYLLIDNKIDFAEAKLKSLNEKISDNDKMLYFDYLLLNILFKYEKREFKGIIEIFSNNLSLIRDYRDILFSKLGIYFRVIIVYILMKKKDSAKELIEEGLLLSEKYSQDYYYPRFIGIKGYFLRFFGEKEQSILYHQEALDKAKLSGYKSEIAFHYKMLSSLELWLRHFQAAFDNNMEAIKINIELGNKQELKSTYFFNGQISVKLGKYEIAIEYYKKALILFEEAKDNQRILQIYNGLGIIYQDYGKLTKALQYYEKALNSAVKNNLIMDKMISTNNIGTIYRFKGEYDKAIELTLKAIEIYINNIGKIRFNINPLYLNLVDLYIYRGNYKSSFEIIKDNINLKNLNIEELGRLYFLKSKANYFMGEIKNAQENAEKALEYYEKTNSPYLVALVLYYIAKIQYIFDEKNNSIELLNKTITLLKESKSYGKLYQEVNIEIIEVLIVNMEFDEAQIRIEELKTIINQKEINFPKYRENQLIFLGFLQKSMEYEIKEREILEFYNRIEEENYYILRIKTLIILIGFYLRNYNFDKALKMIDEGIQLTTTKNNLILELEINFLKSLVLSRQGKIIDAKKLCRSFNSILEENKLVSYQIRQRDTLKLIDDQEDFNLVYGLVEDSKSVKEKNEIQKKIEGEVFDYLSQIMRYVKEKEISLS